jgi:transcriptional regulator GlxA family with amidase domain
VYRRLRGITPARFLRDERLKRAEHLLSVSDVPVHAIGEMVGYREPTAFGRLFRSRTGHSPSDYRKKLGR